jgi:hypothetical protein
MHNLSIRRRLGVGIHEVASVYITLWQEFVLCCGYYVMLSVLQLTGGIAHRKLNKIQVKV